jgi:hypothetical protein
MEMRIFSPTPNKLLGIKIFKRKEWDLTVCLKPGFIRGKELKNWRAILGLRSGWLLKREETWEGDRFGISFWKEGCLCHLGWERMERR